MTRDEHIKQVEELLAGTWERDVYVGRPPHHRPPTPYALALAQVHATMALTESVQDLMKQPEPRRRSWWRRMRRAMLWPKPVIVEQVEMRIE